MASKQQKRDFIGGYLAAAAWASSSACPDCEGRGTGGTVTENCEPDGKCLLCDGSGELESLEHFEYPLVSVIKAARVCLQFIRENEADLEIYSGEVFPVADGSSPWELAGHDLWLTREGHGTGYWDRGAFCAGDRLTDAAEKLGPGDLYAAGVPALLYFS